jgi:hypothetical protein
VLPPDPDSSQLDPRAVEDAERGRTLVLAAAAQTFASPALRERLQDDPRRTRRRTRRPVARGRRALLVPVGGLVAAVVAVVILAGGAGAPTILAAASLAGRGPQVAAPRTDPANPAVLREGVEGVQFPEWGRSFRWRSVGVRYDDIEDRKATTVYYESVRGARAAYTIVTGNRLDAPRAAQQRRYGGTTLYTFQRGGQRIVTWERRGHTCVMSAPVSVPEERLLALASWKGGQGHVAF